MKSQVQLSSASFSKPRFNDDAAFEERAGWHQANDAVSERAFKRRRFSAITQDCDDRRFYLYALNLLGPVIIDVWFAIVSLANGSSCTPSCTGA